MVVPGIHSEYLLLQVDLDSGDIDLEVSEYLDLPLESSDSHGLFGKIHLCPGMQFQAHIVMHDSSHGAVAQFHLRGHFDHGTVGSSMIRASMILKELEFGILFDLPLSTILSDNLAIFMTFLTL